MCPLSGKLHVLVHFACPIFHGKIPQTPQWSLGQNSSVPILVTFGHHLTTPQGLQKFALSVEIAPLIT